MTQPHAKTRRVAWDERNYVRTSVRNQRMKAKRVDEEGRPTPGAVDTRSKIAAARVRKKLRAAEAKATSPGDPGAWECQYCQYPPPSPDTASTDTTAITANTARTANTANTARAANLPV